MNNKLHYNSNITFFISPQSSLSPSKNNNNDKEKKNHASLAAQELKKERKKSVSVVRILVPPYIDNYSKPPPLPRSVILDRRRYTRLVQGGVDVEKGWASFHSGGI